MAISIALRQRVTERAHGLCEYCQTDQAILLYMEVDHIKPESLGGKTEIDNLCLICRGCNGFKYNFITGLDSETKQQHPLFNPRTQQWSEHFRWSGDGISIIGVTPVGRATIHRLKMNRPAIQTARQRWITVGWHPPKT